MKKSYYVFIIIVSTFTSSIMMLYHSIYVTNPNHYAQGKLLKDEKGSHDKAYIKSIYTTKDGYVGSVDKNDEIRINNNGHLESDGLPKKESNNDYRTDDKKNNSNLNEGLQNEDNKTKKLNKEIEKTAGTDSLENYYDYIKENEQAVFKVSTGKIMENLTTSDKIKLFYVSMHLGKEEYKKVEKYLYAEDAEDGVLKALKLLREDLSKQEYEKVRKIAGRFINMDLAEELN